MDPSPLPLEPVSPIIDISRGDWETITMEKYQLIFHMVAANKTLKMSTMIHIIYWALCRWQALYTTLTVACEPIVSSRHCAKHLTHILSCIHRNSPRKWVLIVIHFMLEKTEAQRAVGLPKAIQLISREAEVQDESCCLPNFQAFYLTSTGHLTHLLPWCQCAQAPLCRMDCEVPRRPCPGFKKNRGKQRTRAQRSC